MIYNGKFASLIINFNTRDNATSIFMILVKHYENSN